MTLTSGSIEEKQLNMCRGNIIFCHVGFFCLQGKKEDEKRSIFQYWGDHLSNEFRKTVTDES